MSQRYLLMVVALCLKFLENKMWEWEFSQYILNRVFIGVFESGHMHMSHTMYM
jgi:hypothetical protein